MEKDQKKKNYTTEKDSTSKGAENKNIVIGRRHNVLVLRNVAIIVVVVAVVIVAVM